MKGAVRCFYHQDLKPFLLCFHRALYQGQGERERPGGEGEEEGERQREREGEEEAQSDKRDQEGER